MSALTPRPPLPILGESELLSRDRLPLAQDWERGPGGEGAEFVERSSFYDQARADRGHYTGRGDGA